MEKKCAICSCEHLQFVWTKDGYDLYRCLSCDVLFVANAPSDDELNQYYSFETGYHSGLYNDGSLIQSYVSQAREHLNFVSSFCTSPRNLLDVGCSVGIFLEQARRKGWRVEGVEFSSDTAAIARSQFDLDVNLGDLSTISFGERRFSVITMWEVIEHMRDPQLAIKKVQDILEEDGWLFISTPNEAGLYPVVSRYFARFLGYWGHPDPPGHLFQFSPRSITAMLTSGGFYIEAIRFDRIPITYSFGALKGWLRSLRWFLYCLMFIPLALLGPYFGRGDSMLIAARRSPTRQS